MVSWNCHRNTKADAFNKQILKLFQQFARHKLFDRLYKMEFRIMLSNQAKGGWDWGVQKW